MDIGVLILRLLLAVIFFVHALQKTAGWFQGQGLGVMAEVFESLGLRPGRIMVLLAAGSEMAAGLLILCGVLTPVGACIGAGVMLVAGWTMHYRAGKVWNAAGGGEYPYVLAALCGVVAVTGPGAYSVDRVIARTFEGAGAFLDPSPLHTLIIVALSLSGAAVFRARVRRSAGESARSVE
jgi:putative oxidoreductase